MDQAKGEPEVPRRMGWGSAAAEDMFKIATLIAGFDREELMLEIFRRHVRNGTTGCKTNERTVLAAMQTLYDKHKAENPELYDAQK